MFARNLVVCLMLLLVAGCSNSGALTTGSLTAGNNQQSASPVVRDDPVSRALHVGANSARALKCGYNFDPAKLKSQFMAAQGASVSDAQTMAKVNKAYDTGFNGVTKAISNPKTYCTSQKTAAIKTALNKNLAGDYSPPPQKRVVQTSDSFFGGIFDSDVVEENGPKFGSDDWWESQNEASGK